LELRDNQNPSVEIHEVFRGGMDGCLSNDRSFSILPGGAKGLALKLNAQSPLKQDQQRA